VAIVAGISFQNFEFGTCASSVRPVPVSGLEITMTLGVAILGTGRLGGNYIKSINASDGAETVVVAEPREEQVSDLKTANPDIEFVADY
jgi:hypothetical protein